MLHSTTITTHSIWSTKLYLLRSTNNEVPHEDILASILFPLLTTLYLTSSWCDERNFTQFYKTVQHIHYNKIKWPRQLHMRTIAFSVRGTGFPLPALLNKKRISTTSCFTRFFDVLSKITPLRNFHYLIFGLTLFRLNYRHSLQHFSYGDNIFHLHIFYLRPFFQKRN